MKVFIFILIIAAFLQTSFLNLNICAILLICRSFLVPEKNNLFLAFFIGILLGLLSAENVGFWALVFLLLVKISSSAKKLPFASHSLVIIPLTFITMTLISFLEQTFIQTKFSFLSILFESLIAWPVFLLIRFWEDRPAAKKDVRLKLHS